MSRVGADELLRVLGELDAQGAEVARRADEMGIAPEALRDSSGGWVLVPLVAARAHVLSALALLDALGRAS